MSGGRISRALARGAIGVVELYRNMISPIGRLRAGSPRRAVNTPSTRSVSMGWCGGLGCPWRDWPNVARGIEVDGIRSRSDVRWHPMPRR